MTNTYKFGWQRDSLDHRDRKYAFTPSGNIEDLPQTYDRWKIVKAPPIRNQLQTSSCVGFSTTRALNFISIAQGKPDFTPSPMFLYANTRIMENSLNMDSGCQIRDAIKSSITEGVCSEDDWPFDPPSVCIKPTQGCYADAQSHETLEYKSVDNTKLYDLLLAISTGPVVGGISVFNSFMDAKLGVIPMPADNDVNEGGHALTWTGYDILAKTVTFDNSWGGGWGGYGRGTLPFDYITDSYLADDFWLLTKTE